VQSQSANHENAESEAPAPQSLPGTIGYANPAADAAVAELFVQYHAKLVKSLAALTHSSEEARDIASQAFVEVLSRPPGAVNFLGPYLYRAAHHLAINRLKHQAMCKRKASLVHESVVTPSPESTLAEEERASLAQSALKALPPRLKMSVVLRMWDELTYEEIVLRFASLGVDVSARTVQRYVAKALSQCRRAVRAAERSPEKE
jgi:RNA polymerase sigma factor (sigma-70 family)